MKPSIKTSAAALLLSLGISTLSLAQGMANTNPASTEIIEPVASDNLTAESVKARFLSLFPNATQQKWTSADGNNFVSFLNDGRKARASFTAKGNLNYVITNCGIDNLPAAFSKNMKTSYASYQLFHAIEIKAYGETAYQAILENKQEFITLKFTTDGMEQIQQVRK